MTLPRKPSGGANDNAPWPEAVRVIARAIRLMEGADSLPPLIVIMLSMDGFSIVPTEPTEAMVGAGGQRHRAIYAEMVRKGRVNPHALDMLLGDIRAAGDQS